MDVSKEVKKWAKRNHVKLTKPYISAALQFLFEKKVFIDEHNRSFKFKSVLNPKNALQWKKKFEQSQKRLFQITSEDGDKTFKDLPGDVMSFEQFCKEVPAWGDPNNSYVCFRDDLAMKDSIVQRVQRSGLCYMHAPVVLQHYLVSKGTSAKTGMVNISKYIHDKFTSIELENHIFRNDGGSSTRMLENILMKGSEISTGSPELIHFESTLKQYGPHLVSQFRVYDDFQSSEKWMYSGVPTGEVKGQHAMVLIGMRKESGQLKFLLQNWWSRKQFVEVDYDYLSACEAYISYVETPQMQIPDEFPITTLFFAECMDLDQEDVGVLDGPLDGPSDQEDVGVLGGPLDLNESKRMKLLDE
jgi:hypothetical protein